MRCLQVVKTALTAWLIALVESLVIIIIIQVLDSHCTKGRCLTICLIASQHIFMAICQHQMYSVVTMRCTLLFNIKLAPILLVVLPIFSSSQSACPSQCACSDRPFTVDCQNAGLDRIPHDLPDPVGLKQLDLRGNQITGLVAEVVSYMNLEYLDVSDNQIAHIADHVLDATPRLKYLKMRNNKLQEVLPGMFRGLRSLVELDLSYNNIADVSEGAFKDLSNLEELYLSGNKMNHINETMFEGLNELRHLHMEDNDISTLSSSAFSALGSLSSLNLQYNHLRRIPNDLFSSVSHLRELNIADNVIVEVEAHAFTTRYRVAGQISHLEILSLKNNQLQGVPSQALRNLDKLSVLDLSQNPVVKIDANAFSGMPNLQKLVLCSMPSLAVIENFAFSELQYLQELQLHSNHRLREIQTDAFKATPGLRRVDMHANALETLSANLLEWDRVEVIDLRYNHLRCDCHLLWLRNTLLARASNATRYLGQELRCYTPEQLASKHILDLNPEDFFCSPVEVDVVSTVTTLKDDQFQDKIMIAIMGSIGGVLVIVIVILMIKYRSAYTTAYAPTMDQYVCKPKRTRSRSSMCDMEAQRISVTSDDTASQNLRSSISGPGKNKRRLYRVRFAENMEKCEHDNELDSS